MKTTLISIRAFSLLALASLATGCWQSAVSGRPNTEDAGTDSGGGTGGGAGGAAADASDSHANTGDVGSDLGQAGDAHTDAGGEVAVDAGPPPAPLLSVSQGNVPVASGASVAITGAVVSSSASTVFKISNTGTADLTIGGVTVGASAFSLSLPPAATVAAGASTTFTILFSPAVVGPANATVAIANNASAGFSFTITAQATAAPEPAISVSGGAGDIASGGTLAFGSVSAGTTMDQTVTVRNTGSAPLVLSSAPVVTGSAFSLKTPPASLTIAAGDLTTFVVTFAPLATGDQTGGITIANNTTDQSSYAVNLTGTGVIIPTGFNVTGANGAMSIGAIGGTLQLTATIVPTGAPNPGVTWSSGTPAVATVDPASGLVTAVSNGTTVITATATDGSGITGTLTVTVANPFVYFVTQPSSTSTTASLANGTFAVSSTFGASGNAFKYAAPNYYGTNSNGFIAFPTPMTGDFSITANVTITLQNKFNNACGIGAGMTTGFSGTDSYAYALMRNSATTGATTGVVNGDYVSGATATSAPTTVVNVPFTNGTPVPLTFSRTGTNVTYGVGGAAPTTTTVPTSTFTNGTTVYGNSPVYPAISFNNVTATITNLVITDGTGTTVFDSATGILVTYVPAALTLSTATANLAKGASTTVTATAKAVGGTVSGVTAMSADSTIATATVVNGATNSIITLNALKAGTTTVTVTNAGDPSSTTNTKTITVTVNEYATSDPYTSLALLAYPAPGTTNAYTDGELSLTFDSPPTLNTGGTIRIVRASDGTEVDAIAFANETQTYGTTVINVGSQLVRVSGNTVFFAPHLGKLAYGTAYYVAIPTTSISGTLTGVAFNGFSNLSAIATWNFTTRAAPTLSAAGVTVDGSQASTANFRTLQGALGALATGLAGITPVTINVAPGTYNELIHYTGPGLTQTINIIGPAGNVQGDSCVIQYSNGNTPNPTTQTRPSAYFAGTNLVLQNITLRNTGVRAAVAQAEALYFASGAGFTLAAGNSSFFSNQDTIQTSGRSWFYNCHVEGNVDFLWGTGDAALFENCSLRFINDMAGAAVSYSLFVARTGTTIAAGASGTIGKGYVLLNSTVVLDPNVTAFFGRDAGVGAFYDQAALINVTFSGAATSAIGVGIWNVNPLPLSLVDPSIVGWKSAGCVGLNLTNAPTVTTDTHTSATINSQASEYDTRADILNRVVTVTAGAPTGFQAAATTWDTSGLATAFGAP